jgi:hypothetical protein
MTRMEFQSTMNSFTPVFVEDLCAASPKSDTLAHAWLEREPAPIAQFGFEFAFEHVEHVPAVAPVIGEIAGRMPTMRTRRSPISSVRHSASPVMPGCVVVGIRLQSVTVKGRVGIFMRVCP